MGKRRKRPNFLGIKIRQEAADIVAIVVPCFAVRSKAPWILHRDVDVQLHLEGFVLEVGRGRSLVKNPCILWLLYMCDCWSKLPLFSYGRDGHQLYSRGLNTHHQDSLLEVG